MKRKLLFLFLLLSLNGFAQLFEGFEGNVWPPEGWSIYDNGIGTTFTWEQTALGSPVYSPYGGNHAAVIKREDVTSGLAEDWLVTHQFTVPEDGLLSFYSRLTQLGDQGTLYEIRITTADPELLESYILLDEWTEFEINPVQQDYLQIGVALPEALAGQQAHIAFVMKGDDGDRWLIDNVSIGQGCAPPNDLSVNNLTTNSLDISWSNPSGNTAWEIEVLPVDAFPTGIGTIVTSAPYTVTSLAPATCYKFYIRSLCGPDENSMWTGPYFFCTYVCEPIDQCIYTFDLTDTGNNGWDGGAMKVIQNGATLATLQLAGGQSSVNVPLCHDIPFELRWTIEGSAPEEMGVTVKNAFNQTIYTKPPGTGEPGTMLITAAAQCMFIDCFIPPAGLSTDVLGTSVSLDWFGADNGTWEYLLLPAGSPLPTSAAEGTVVTSHPVMVSDLEPATEYIFYVRVVCGPGNTSVWSVSDVFSIGTGNAFTIDVMLNANGDEICDNQDISVPGIEIMVSVNGEDSYSVYTNPQGKAIINNLANGINTISLYPLVSQGFEAMAPVTQEITFGEGGSTGSYVYCVPMTDDLLTDISATLSPVNNAIPGTTAKYKLSIANNGIFSITGATVSLEFDGSRLQFMSSGAPSTVNGNSLTIDIGDIGPFGMANTNILFHVLEPPVNTGGEELVFTGTVGMDQEDDVPANNDFLLSQIIVNSYDPNDIIVHEGAYITEEQAGDFLTYTIRFQNTGTAAAINVRLENTLEDQLDWNTFQPLGSSHNYTVTRQEAQLEFMFANINLPHNTSNEEESHGYVTYRIKPKPSFGLGDIIANTAEIYFDFNEPIVTNTVTTEVVSLGSEDNYKQRFVVYPNPVKDKLHLALNAVDVENVQVYDINGRICINTTNTNSVDMHALKAGMYFIKVTALNCSETYKIIKE